VVAGAVAGAAVLPLLLALTFVRWPEAPILGDGDAIALMALSAYGVAALVGALIGHALATRSRVASVPSRD
jgi:hypothetical protein